MGGTKLLSEFAMMARRNSLLILCFVLVLTGCRHDQDHAVLTPLLGAVVVQDADQVVMLLDAGADPNESVEPGVTALGFAVGGHINVPERQKRKLKGLAGPAEENTEILNALLESGADPNRISAGMGVPLNIAAYQGLPQSVRLLLDFGADPNFHGEDGITALWISAFHCYPDIAEILIEFAADVSIKDNAGETAKSVAERKNCPEVVQLIEMQTDGSK